MLLAGGDGVGLAGFEDGITCVGVGLDLFRARCLQDGSRMSGGNPDLTKVSGATSMVGESEVVHRPRSHKEFLD